MVDFFDESMVWKGAGWPNSGPVGPQREYPSPLGSGSLHIRHPGLDGGNPLLLGSEDPPSPEAPPWWFPILAHLFLFGVLGFLVQLTLVTLERSSGWLFSLTMVVAIGFLWGLATELYQTTIPTRSASWEDLLWDAAGALLGGTGARLAEIGPSRYSGWRSLFYP